MDDFNPDNFQFTEDDYLIIKNQGNMTSQELINLEMFFENFEEHEEEVQDVELQPEKDMNDLKNFLHEIDFDFGMDESQRKESFMTPNEGCNLENISMKKVHYSRIIRFCNVVKEILSDFETPDFENVRFEINRIKKQNLDEKNISRDKILDLLVHWDYKPLLAYITQKKVDNSGINYKKVFKTIMSNIPSYNSSVYNKIFDNKLIYGQYISNGINVTGFVCIETSL